MISTRRLILDYLEKKSIATAPEISRALNTTAANIRHHLSILSLEGVVEVVGERPTQNRGRPSQLYALASRAHQNNLGILAGALLDELLTSLPENDRLNFLKRIAIRLAGEPAPAKNLTQRLYLAIHRLNELKYNARWEAHRNTPFIILGHCPFAMILHDHPELCQIDGMLLENLLSTPVKQAEKLAIDNQGISYCKFIVQQK